MFNFDLSQIIESYLLKNRECREYDIICHLQEQNHLPKDVLRHPLSMFRSHFLIFNALYRLQLKTHIHRQYDLDINSLLITLTPTSDNTANNQFSTSNNKPGRYSALSLFYLDYKQVMQTTEQDVNRLLDSFWKHYFNDDQKQKALGVLELSEPVTSHDIKQQYRRLAMKHHPDRGGDADKLVAIHQAKQCLEMYF